jgi:hypothetical protein
MPNRSTGPATMITDDFPPLYSRHGKSSVIMVLVELGHVMLSLKSLTPPTRAARLVIEWTADLSQPALGPAPQD